MQKMCECHGEPLRWTADRRKKAGGSWRCAVRVREAHIRYRHNHPDRLAETRARDNASRIFVGGLYLAREGRFPYPREAVERHLLGKLDEFRQRQAEEAVAERERLADEAVSFEPQSVIDLPEMRLA